MKTFFGITIALVVFQFAESVYDGRIRSQTNFDANNLIDVDGDDQGTGCAKGFTGQVPYAMDCRQYVNCWKGHGTIQSCAPGTMFNPISMECDHPSKVKCRRFEEFNESPPLARSPPSARSHGSVGRIECDAGASGLFAHPSDCAKFLNCNNGATFIQDCGPGTLFNARLKVCDWPHNTDCANRQGTNGGNRPQAGTVEVPPYYGEGVIQARNYPSASGSSGYRSSNNHSPNTNSNLKYPSSVRSVPLAPYGNGNAYGGYGRLTQQSNAAELSVNKRFTSSTPYPPSATSTDNVWQAHNQLDYEGHTDSIDQAAYNPNGKLIKCKAAWVGLYPHPFDCRKFLNCNNGATFIQDCGPGTAFNPALQVCDWPHNVNCSRKSVDYDQELGEHDTDATNTNLLVNHEQESGLSQAETIAQHVTAQPSRVTYPLLSQHIDDDFKKYFYDESQLKQTAQSVPISANNNNFDNLNSQSKPDYNTQNTQFHGNGLAATNTNQYQSPHPATQTVDFNYPPISANRKYEQNPDSNADRNAFGQVPSRGQSPHPATQTVDFNYPPISANRKYGPNPDSNADRNAFGQVPSRGQQSTTNQNSFTAENQYGVQNRKPLLHGQNEGVNTNVETQISGANPNVQYGQNGVNTVVTTQHTPSSGYNPYVTRPLVSPENFNSQNAAVNTQYGQAVPQAQNSANRPQTQFNQFEGNQQQHTQFHKEIATESSVANGPTRDIFGGANPQFNVHGSKGRAEFEQNILNGHSNPGGANAQPELTQNGQNYQPKVVNTPSQIPQVEIYPNKWNAANSFNILDDKNKDVKTNLIGADEKPFDRNGKSNPKTQFEDRDAPPFASETGFIGVCSVPGLMKHPFDCSKFVNCENEKAFEQNCAPGTLFNPVLKICDFARKVNCSAGPPLPHQFGISYDLQPPKVDMNDPSAVSISNGYSKTTKNAPQPTTTTRPTPPTTPSYQQPHFAIPNMSVLPLSHSNDGAKYPVDSNEDDRREPTTPSPSKPRPKPVYYPNLGRPSYGTDTAAEDIESFVQQIQRPNDQVYRDSKSVVVNEPPTTRQPIPKEKEHIMPIYNRRSTTPRPSTLSVQNQYAGQSDYNKVTSQKNYENQPIDTKIQTDYLPLNEAFKLLLRPYVNEKANETSTQMLEKKILEMADQHNDTKTVHSATLEQPSLARAFYDEKANDGVNREANYDYYAHLNYDRTQKHDQNCQHYHPPSTFYHLPPNFKHSPEFHEYMNRKHALSNKEFYVEDNSQANPPSNVELLPGAALHPQHGHQPASSYNHHQHHSSSHHRPHHQPNEHRWLPYPGRTTPPPTNTLAEPIFGDSFSQTTAPQSRTLDGHCVDQLNCQNGLCVPFNKVCDGRNDCGNRYDESACQHVGYEIRLSNEGGQKHMGRIEVKAFGRWGYVCDDKFSLTDANVVCRELGFKMGAAEVKSNSYYAPNANMSVESMFIMDEVNCSGIEGSLRECDFNGWGESDCNAEEVVGVVCKMPVMKCPANYFLCEASEQCVPINFMCDGVNDCSDGADENRSYCNAPIEYRLADGNEFEGRVEVKYRGIWGTVCDDDFGEAEATVMCNSLGFNGPAEILNERIGYASGPIWLDQVSCLGNETNLDKCMHFQWGESNCNHTEDISVRCSHGAGRKSAKLVLAQDHNSLSELDAETQQYLRENQRSSKSVPDYSNVCGQVKVSADDVESSAEQLGQFRVISGTRTKRGHHPWQATIRARGRNGRSSHWCGAVVLSKNHILTAAHCLIGFPKGAYFIRLGDHHSEVYEDSEVEIFIEDWFIHEEFRKGQHMNNDIALILLKQPIQFSNYIQPICLPSSDAIYAPGRNCTISGWGSIQYGKSTPSLDLKAANVPIISQDVCRQKHIYGDAIMETMFCAGYLDQSGVDACDGDSGGPLVCADQTGINSLYGIISWGQRCGDSTKPGVYVKVAKYLDWIKEKMNVNRATRRA